MKEQTAIQREIVSFVEDFVARYPAENGTPALWRKPLVSFADARDPYIQNLPQLINERHMLPQDFLPSATVVISCFFPFLPEVANSNIGVEDNMPSLQWNDAYGVTNTMIGRLNEALAAFIRSRGYEAAVPEGVCMFQDILMSNWSQRHLAYAGGLGTFGINNMLITDSGCCGRLGSLVADIPAVTTGRREVENCLYKKNGSCSKCLSNCFSGALHIGNLDRQKCRTMCDRNGTDSCGKCDTNIPCAFAIPGTV
ncbi:MAG: epoxyqueuosine reductase [Ruminococcaceae bacterium]|nr:epoxyqueuosine reductase [Oscillospiraceae bacterium]